MKVISCIALFLSFISSPVFASDIPHKTLEVHNPWVREAPPTIKILAGYFTLHNHSDKTHTVLSVTSPQFDRVEIHRTEIKEEMAHMAPVSKIIIGPKNQVLFEPNGLHLMLINPKGKVKKGDKLNLILHLSDKL